MRILAIRGENLASLEGSFELALAEGPLFDAGVFAICGATGSGKSTLLDAMCLALYDTSPRLERSRRVKVGAETDEDRLSTRDPRSILRKGSGRGHAEVDFEGVDGRRYRARWEVRRARERADGKMQSSALSLLDLESEMRWAGRKTDVLMEIEARVGLSFDQFRRSVLLAQGEFAAFLDADPRERADVLERMTGTAIYGAISQEAHGRVSRESARLDLLQERLSAIPELGEEARERLEAELEGLSIRIVEDERDLADASAALRWHHELEGLKKEEALALEDQQRTLRQLALVETGRHELTLYEAALPLRGPLDAVEAAAAARDARAREVEEVTAARVGHAKRVRDLADRVMAAAERADQAERTWEGTRDRVERARAIELAIADRLEREAASAEESERAEAARAEASRALAELEARIATAEESASRAREWLSENPLAHALTEDWARAHEHLRRVVELEEQAAPLAGELEAARLAQADKDRCVSAAEGTRSGAARRAAELALARDAAEAAAEERAPRILTAERQRWVARRTSIEALLGVTDRASQALAAELRQTAEAEHADAAAEAASARAHRAEAERVTLAARLDEALALRDRIRATMDLAERRRDLAPGEPCPLCGSADHPYAHEAPAVSALLADADARARELRDRLASGERAIAEAEKETEAERSHAARARAEAASWQSALTEARERYRELAQGLDGPWPEELAEPTPATEEGSSDWGPLFERVTAPRAQPGELLSSDARTALEEARRAAIEHLDELAAVEREKLEREEQARDARARFERAREAELRAHEALERARREAGAAADKAARVEATLERARSERARSMERVAAVLEPFDGWRERLLGGAERFVAELADAVSARRTWLEIARRAEETRTSLGPARDGARVRAEEANAAAERASAARAAAAEALVVERRRLSAEVGDASPNDLLEAADRALEAARTDAASSQSALRAADRDEAEASAREERARHGLREAQVFFETKDAELEHALGEAGIDRATARERLARDPAWVESFRGELARLDERRARESAVFAERRRKREVHETTEPPKLDAERAAEAALAARQRLAETRALAAAAQGRLESDRARQEEARQLQLQMADQLAELETWTMLADLIGSASGNKLRVFAQSLTLEVLLEHANVHLRELAPRYSLARVPGEDLALQIVDHEMGDEVRAVSSLSGGESFLVALGLALALASLSAQDARVDSLFIDEGFGALDPASLELVLGTLDVLHASGRQVGLISHIPAVAERFDTRVHVVAAGPARSRVELVHRAM
ncbi:MAG: AAA family ATPase [Sandaracinaceae bacterium]